MYWYLLRELLGLPERCCYLRELPGLHWKQEPERCWMELERNRRRIRQEL